MKKLLFSLVLLGTISNAQVLQQENFETLTIGNVSVDATGATPGQGGWSTTGSAVTDFQIINSGTDKDLRITGAPLNATTSRYMWKNGLDAAWSTRTTGNNIIQVEYDFFTGPATTSLNTVGMELYNTDYSRYLGGLRMDAATKEISGIFTTATGTTSLVTLGATPVILPANQWVRVGWAYNSTTGLITFKGPGFDGTITGAIASVYELDFVMENSATTGNTSSFNAQYDNLIVRAVSTVNILGTNESIIESKDISIYPNPAVDFINISSKVKILAAYIYDMSGIRMDANMVDGKVNVKNLQTGTYLLGLKTDKGLVTKQFIKK